MATFNSDGNLEGVNPQGTIPGSGYKGNIIESVITAGAAFGTSNTAQDITSVTLTPGVWMVSGAISISGTTFVGTQLAGWTGTTSGNSTVDLVSGSTAAYALAFPTADVNTVIVLPTKFYNVAVNTIVYLKVKSIYSVLGNGQYSGTIRALCVG